MGDIEKNTQVGWDSRQGFTTIVTSYLSNISRANYEEDLRAWYKLLRGFVALATPYLKQKDLEEIEKELAKAGGSISMYYKNQSAYNRPAFKNIVVNQLQSLQQLIYKGAKDLLLLSKESEDYTMEDIESLID